jgi:hypothetical protein
MDSNTVAIGSAIIASIVAVAVPWFTFRLALRQDQQRWLREQRSQLYVDLLTEAYAEERYSNTRRRTRRRNSGPSSFSEGQTSGCRRWSGRSSVPEHRYSAARPSTVCSTRSIP